MQRGTFLRLSLFRMHATRGHLYHPLPQVNLVMSKRYSLTRVQDRPPLAHAGSEQPPSHRRQEIL